MMTERSGVWSSNLGTPISLAKVRAEAIAELDSLSLPLDVRTLEVDLLLGYVFGVKRATLISSLHDTPRQLLRYSEQHRGRAKLIDLEVNDWYDGRLRFFHTLLLRRKSHEPVAYLVGEKEFYGRPFSVGPGVLIPRPETELIVDIIFDQFRKVWHSNLACPIQTWSICDLGVGSGALLVTILAEAAKAKFSPPQAALGIDISEAALRYTAENLAKHLPAHALINASEAENSIELRLASFMTRLDFSNLKDSDLSILVSNPPYIAPTENLPRDVKEFEPADALFADQHGLAAIDQVLKRASEAWNAARNLKQILVCEIGSEQGHIALTLASRLVTSRGALEVPKILKDLAGRDRVLLCEWNLKSAQSRGI